MNLQNVPMLGDDAAALLAGLYEADQVDSFTNVEAAGLKFVLVSFVHFDVGGHDGGRKETHARSQGLHVEAALRESRDGAVRSMHVQRCRRTTHWMALQFQHFLASSGHFFRLVQATAEGVRRYMDAPTRNHVSKF